MTYPRRMVTTRSRNAQETRADILAAARPRFGAEGYERTTLRAVAADVGVHPGPTRRPDGFVHHRPGDHALRLDQPVRGRPQPRRTDPLGRAGGAPTPGRARAGRVAALDTGAGTCSSSGVLDFPVENLTAED